MDANRGNNTIFTYQTANLISFGSTLPHQFFPNAMSSLNILLGSCFECYEAHIGSAHCFTNRFSINFVVLIALYVRLNELSRNQANMITKLLKLSSPMMVSVASSTH